MIFALWDYFNYRRQAGRYGNDQTDGGMHVAFYDKVPNEVIEELNEGDAFFTQRLDSFRSWAMMYFTSSPVDHVGVYAGDGRVFHMTLDGSKIHSVRSVAKGSRILFCRIGYERPRWVERTNELESRLDKGNFFVHSFPPKVQLVFGAIKIVSGKYPDRFHWKFLVDVFLLCLLFDLLSFFAFGLHLGAVIAVVYLIGLAINFLKFVIRKIRRTPHPIMSHPDTGYQAFFYSGGLMFTKLGHLVVCELGILPLKVVLGFARQSTDDGSDHKFQEAGQFFSYLVEGWNLHPQTEKAKYPNPYQEQNEEIQKSPDHPRQTDKDTKLL